VCIYKFKLVITYSQSAFRCSTKLAAPFIFSHVGIINTKFLINTSFESKRREEKRGGKRRDGNRQEKKEEDVRRDERREERRGLSLHSNPL
jgi:hypothetical protein